MVELPSDECVVGVGSSVYSEGKRVHPYGGAAAMRNGVMPVQWEGKCIVQELFVALSFFFAFAFALSCSFYPHLYDSRINGLMRLLGTSLSRVFPLPLASPFGPSSCPTSSWSSSCLSSAAGPPQTDPKRSRHGLFAPFSSLPCRFMQERSPAG